MVDHHQPIGEYPLRVGIPRSDARRRRRSRPSPRSPDIRHIRRRSRKGHPGTGSRTRATAVTDTPAPAARRCRLRRRDRRRLQPRADPVAHDLRQRPRRVADEREPIQPRFDMRAVEPEHGRRIPVQPQHNRFRIDGPIDHLVQDRELGRQYGTGTGRVRTGTGRGQVGAASGPRSAAQGSARDRTALRFGPSHSRVSRAKFRSSSAPNSPAIDSGWNCTPHWGRRRCRTPITTPSGAVAVIASASGSGWAAHSE